MTNKAVFLDRDGIINVDKNYVYKTEDLEIISGVVEGLRKLWTRHEYELIITTNQSGIARGYYTKEDYLKFRESLHRELLYKDVFIREEYFCPHRKEDNCNCRKPKTGMLEQAAMDFDLNLKECWMIGDNLSDIVTGINAGCRTIHVLTGEEKKPTIYADFVAKDMIEAADIILFEDKNK